MNTFRTAATSLLLSLAASAFAAPTPVLIQSEPGKGAERTINLQTSEGSSCATPAIGNCGSCSVSCPTGQSASCKPGISVGPQAGASCVTSPECKCQ